MSLLKSVGGNSLDESLEEYYQTSGLLEKIEYGLFGVFHVITENTSKTPPTLLHRKWKISGTYLKTSVTLRA